MFLGGRELKELTVERDLSVLVQDDLKVSQQCCKAANKGNSVLGGINRAFTLKSKSIILPLCKSLVRLHLDYAIPAWCPHYQKDIAVLEQVQRRATKMVNGLQNITYEQRLQVLGLTMFKTRMIRADLIQKILNNIDHVNKDKFFTFALDNRRGHSLKLYKSRFNLDIGKFAFSNRVCDNWNCLLEHIVTATSLNIFKNKLDCHL